MKHHKECCLSGAEYRRYFNRILLVGCVLLTAPASHAVSVNTQLTVGPAFQFMEDASFVSDQIVIGGETAAAGSADVGTGELRSFTRTTMVSDGGGFDDRRSQSGVNLLDLAFSWGDPLGVYEIGPGQIGMNFEAEYLRNIVNADSGQHFFSLELLAQHRDPRFALLGFSRARIIHTVNFDSAGVMEVPLNNLSGSGGVMDPGPGVYVENSRSVDGINGSFLLPMFSLGFDDTLTLSATLFTQAQVVAPRGTAPSDLPMASIDAFNTAQLFANFDLNPNLSVNTNVPLDWVGTSAIPIPGAVWLFGTAIGMLICLRRKWA